MFIPDPDFSILDLKSRFKKAPDPGSGFANNKLTKKISIFYPKIVTKLPEIRSGMFGS
jgi:hypothetical protein